MGAQVKTWDACKRVFMIPITFIPQLQRLTQIVDIYGNEYSVSAWTQLGTAPKDAAGPRSGRHVDWNDDGAAPAYDPPPAQRHPLHVGKIFYI